MQAESGQHVRAVFVCGRQHSGNTLASHLLASVPGCFCIPDEGVFFEHRSRLDRLNDPDAAARWIGRNLKLADAELTRRVGEHLLRWTAAHPGVSPLNQYREAMRFLTEATGNRFWAQKATSYIFYADEILRDMPEAQIVYLVRNPYDICASKKRRAPKEERIVGMTVAWNRGARAAESLARREPDRVLIMPYERLVREQEPSIRELCAFLGISYDPALLDLPLVNPSEAKYRVVEPGHGISAGRVYRYPQQLDAAEVAAIDMIADRAIVDRYYPDPPHRGTPIGLGTRCRAAWLVVIGPLRYLADKVRFARRFGLPLGSRLRRRLFG